MIPNYGFPMSSSLFLQMKLAEACGGDEQGLPRKYGCLEGA